VSKRKVEEKRIVAERPSEAYTRFVEGLITSIGGVTVAQVDRAIEDSIAHWRRMSELTVKRVDSEAPTGANCPLCRLFTRVNKESNHQCFGCPVSTKTGETSCVLTPYSAANREWMSTDFDQGFTDDWKELALAEVAFLESLRTSTPPAAHSVETKKEK
jgi:hypothetical protein